jgi:hypothetical protein
MTDDREPATQSFRTIPVFPAVYNDVLAKMIQAEEIEGGRPAPEPCDMPAAMSSPNGAASSTPSRMGRTR